MRPGTLARGQHAVATYSTDDEHWDITAEFLAAGLLRGQQVVYGDDGGTVSAVLRRMADNGLDHRSYQSCGQLIVEPVELPTRTAGVTPCTVAALIGARLDTALTAGYSGMCMVFETGTFLRDTGDVDWLLQVDAACAPLWATRPAAGLCQLDERLTSPGQRAEARRRHGYEVAIPATYDDGQLRITRDRAGHRRLVGAVDLANRDALRRELERAAQETGGDIRLTTASMRFTDAASLGLLAETARHLGPGRQLVLERPGPSLRRIVQLCGLDDIPALVIDRDGQGGRE